MEYFDILTEDGQKTGEVKERGAIHRDGDWHGSIHIWIFRMRNGEPQVLLQRRSMQKDSYPGLLDAACTGHADAGESYIEAALRELSEELNLLAEESDLQFLFSQKEYINEVYCDTPFISREINYVYLLRPGVCLQTPRFQEEEIDELLWLPCDAVRSALNVKDSSYCLIPDEYERVFSYFLSACGPSDHPASPCHIPSGPAFPGVPLVGSEESSSSPVSPPGCSSNQPAFQDGQN